MTETQVWFALIASAATLMSFAAALYEAVRKPKIAEFCDPGGNCLLTVSGYTVPEAEKMMRSMMDHARDTLLKAMREEKARGGKT